jgi:hypothetical protein
MAMSSQNSLKSVDDGVQPVFGEHGLASEIFPKEALDRRAKYDNPDLQLQKK